jgi:hypothetical protein
MMVRKNYELRITNYGVVRKRRRVLRIKNYELRICGEIYAFTISPQIRNS